MTPSLPAGPSRAAVRLATLVVALLGAVVVTGTTPGAASEGRPIDQAELLPPERSARVVVYEMDVTLDPERHEIEGSQRITWRNDSDEPVPSLWWHLYLNAFLSDQTTLSREGEGQGRGRGAADRDARRVGERWYWGFCLLREMELQDGTDLLASLEYRQPDDGNAEDRTVARVVLPEPVPPGGSVTVETSFVSKLPWARRRTGYAGDYHFAAQWYPKLAVYEGVAVNPETEGWNAHQYHAHTEFYADYGTFRVNITVPGSHGGDDGGKVGATGRLVSSFGPADDGSWTYRFIQEDVHDFTWTTDPDFVVEERTFRHAERRTAAVREEERFQLEEVGAPPEALELPDVSVRLLLQPQHADQADRHFEATFHALTWYGLWFGPYPYPTLTVVDPQRDGNRTGGMEYPTLFTAGTRWLVPDAPHWPGPEGVTIHEFGHQHFYGLIGNNEFEEAWLDEGFNSYADDAVIDAAYGGTIRHSPFAHVFLPVRPVLPLPDGDGWSMKSLLHFHRLGLRRGSLADRLFQHPDLTWARGVRVTAPWGSRPGYLDHGFKDPMDTASWMTLDRGSYGAIAYRKPALLLTQLERTLGRDRFHRAVRLHAARHRYGHPNGTDFFLALEETTGLAVDEARRYLAPEELDYAVASVTVKKVRPPVGLRPAEGGFDFDGPDEGGDEGESAADEWRSVVDVQRRGTLTAPVEIAVTFAEAEEAEIFHWDGRDPWHRLEFVREEKVVRVEVDPREALTLDVDRLNNHWVSENDELPAWSWAARVFVLLQSMFLGARALS